MHTIQCEQCDKKFTKTSKKKAASAMRMHVGRAHGNIRTANKGQSNGGGVVHAVAEKSKASAVLTLGTRVRRSAPKAKRSYVRRNTGAPKRTRQEVMAEVEGKIEIAQAAEDFHYCPRCAFNLGVALKAVVLARRHEVK